MDSSGLMFTKENLEEKTAKIAITAAFIVGLSGRWIYNAFDIDPTYILPIIALIPAWKVTEEQNIQGLMSILTGYAFATFIYTAALCIPAGIGLAITNFFS